MKKKLIIFILLCFVALLQNSITTCSAKSLNKPKNFSYSEFIEGKDTTFFKFSRFSSIDRNALQLTPDNENQENGYSNKSGRITYHEPYKLWSSDTTNDDVIASFNTFFVFNLYRNDTWEAGEGLAFLISPDHELPQESYGQWLGLTNVTTDGKPGNHMVAIEFDTRKQGFDPIGNHVGLNINSVNSSKTVPAKFEPTANYSVWIEYDGESKLMEVYMANDGDDKPQNPILSETINLKLYVKQFSYFGFSGSTGDPAKQLNCVVKWKLEVEDLSSKKDWKPFIIGFSVGFPLMALVLVLLGIKLRRVIMKKKEKSRDEESNVLGTLKRLPGMPREFKYKDLKRATNNFDESMILGKGGFGVVYRGLLREDNGHNTNITSCTELAVKMFSRDNINGKEDFLAELTIIHRLRHKHLVRLVGTKKLKPHLYFSFINHYFVWLFCFEHTKLVETVPD